MVYTKPLFNKYIGQVRTNAELDRRQSVVGRQSRNKRGKSRCNWAGLGCDYQRWQEIKGTGSFSSGNFGRSSNCRRKKKIE